MFKLTVLLLIIQYSNCDQFSQPNKVAEVCSVSGCFRGKVENWRNNTYDAFYGIPYAEPPVGELRLENPVAHSGWSGYWNATYPRSDCFQRNYLIYPREIVGSEDCLYLNVYRPKDLTRKLPVMIFIPGGGFMSFSSSPGQYGPEYLMNTKRIILVTMNYRLGMFGFLCSGDAAVKGNFGLKDQQMALKWVTYNIAAFGGDPNSITLSGESAGAASVQYHMMNPVSQALFHRAIVMSGSANSYWAYGNNLNVTFRQSAKNIGLENWETASTFQLAREFKKLDSLSFIKAFDQLFIFPLVRSIPLRPCIEGDWDGAFMKENPRTTWSEGNFNHKPILFTTVANEGLLAGAIGTNGTLLRQFSENMKRFIPIQFEFSPMYLNDILNFYLQGKDYIDETNVESYYQMYGDRLFYHPIFKSALQYLSYTDVQVNPVFIYKFAFKGSHTFLKPMTGKDINLGVSHVDDLIYLFTMKDLLPTLKPKTLEMRMSKILIRTVIKFVVRGQVKSWTNFEDCSIQSSEPFCYYQIFTRCQESLCMSASNEIDQGMMELWDKVGYVD